MREIVEQVWVVQESVRTISAIVPIVSFTTRFAGPGGQPVRLDVSFESLIHNGLPTNEFVMTTIAERCGRQ